MFVSGLGSSPRNWFGVGFGSIVLGIALVGRVAAFVSPKPLHPDAAMTPRRLLAAYRWYAKRSLGRMLLVSLGGLWILSNSVKLVRSMADQKWSWAAAYASLEIFLVAMAIDGSRRLERRSRSAENDGPDSKATEPVPAPEGLPVKEGWTLESGRWRCVVHNTLYCKICASLTPSDPSSSR